MPVVCCDGWGCTTTAVGQLGDYVGTVQLKQLVIAKKQYNTEYLTAKHIFNSYGGYIFKLSVNKDIAYLSTEEQSRYYWYLALAYYNHVITNKLLAIHTYHNISDLKKSDRDAIITRAFKMLYPVEHNNTRRYFENMPG